MNGLGGPGFAPAAGERGMVVWQGAAVCGTVLMALSVLLTSVALVVALVLEAGAATGQGPVASGVGPAGRARRGAAGLSGPTDPEASYLPGAVGVAPRPEAAPFADGSPGSTMEDTGRGGRAVEEPRQTDGHAGPNPPSGDRRTSVEGR